MKFEQDRTLESVGEKAGFAFSYLLFTTLLFIILAYLETIPPYWTWLHVAAITLVIVLLGFGIRRLLQ